MKVTIEFDDNNITQLLKAVHLGVWVQNATKADEEIDEAANTFEQYILGSLHSAGEKTRIVQSPDGAYALTNEYDEALYEKVSEYDSDTFWDELIDQLARRDYYQKNPAKVGKPLEGKALDEAVAGVDREKAKYDKEFEEFGVERLRLVR